MQQFKYTNFTDLIAAITSALTNPDNNPNELLKIL